MKREPKTNPWEEQCPFCYSWDRKHYHEYSRLYRHKKTGERKEIMGDIWECLNCACRWQTARERAGEDWELDFRH